MPVSVRRGEYAERLFRRGFAGVRTGLGAAKGRPKAYSTKGARICAFLCTMRRKAPATKIAGATGNAGASRGARVPGLAPWATFYRPDGLPVPRRAVSVKA
jgi:hypothetical protein